MSDTVVEQRARGTDAVGPSQLRRGLASTSGRTSPRFYVCVAVLLLAAVSMQGLARALGGYFRKVAVPLKRPLDALDQAKLLPEYVPHLKQPDPLDHETVANLGTEQYLNWHLTDTDRDRDDPTSRARLFVTYYTGQPDMVPHNPKECLAAAGLTLRNETLIDVSVPTRAGGEIEIPVRVLDFKVPDGRTLPLGGGSDEADLVVAFFFYANGRYVTTRTGVRTVTQTLRDRYAYYSKIELSFTDDAQGRRANREQTIEATRRLVRKLMPILWDDHYQDWEALKGGAEPVILN